LQNFCTFAKVQKFCKIVALLQKCRIFAKLLHFCKISHFFKIVALLQNCRIFASKQEEDVVLNSSAKDLAMPKVGGAWHVGNTGRRNQVSPF
jgi:hypothetical protein